MAPFPILLRGLAAVRNAIIEDKLLEIHKLRELAKKLS